MMPIHALAARKIRARQIREADLPSVANLLARGFKNHPHRFWAELLARLAQRAIPESFPKYGYLLESDGCAVGTILVIASTVPYDGRHTIRCNVSSWYMDPAYRGYGSFLVSKALSHTNATYLNVTPAPHTWAIVEQQGYSLYSRGVFVAIPALQPYSGRQVEVIGAQARMTAHTDPDEHELLLEHARYGCISLWCKEGERAHPFVFRPRVVKRVIVCAQLVYCRGVDEFVRFAGPVGRHLARQGRAVVLIDANGPIPGLIGKYLDGKKMRYFKGPDRPRLGDLAYTESALFGL